MDGKLRIGYVATLLGVTPHYLRMLEWEGRIPEVGYDRVGRFYTEADVELLKAMGVGNKPRRLRSTEEILGAS
jgi:DNA-binding transcriptional MerR regulator